MPETDDAQPQAQKLAAAALQAKLNQGMALHRQGKLADAERCYGEVLQRQPDHFDALHLLGVIAHQTRQTERGVELIKRAIGLNPKVAAAHNNLGNALMDLKRSAEALASYDKAIALKPDFAEAHYNRGNALMDLKRPAEALASYDKAIALKPDFAEAHNNRGNALRDLKRPAEALASYDKAIALKARLRRGTQQSRQCADGPEASRGSAGKLRQGDRAKARLCGGAQQSWQCAEGPEASRGGAGELRQGNRAESQTYAVGAQQSRQCAEGLQASRGGAGELRKAIALKPDYAEAHSNRGTALMDLKRPAEALASYEKAIALKPDFEFLYGNLIHMKMRICDWSNLETQIAQLVHKIDQSEKVSAPFPFLAMTNSPALQRKAAVIYATATYPLDNALPEIAKRPRHNKIRIGYFSADFRNHPGAYSMVEMFERHDRSKFELFGFSFSTESEYELKSRLESCF